MSSGKFINNVNCSPCPDPPCPIVKTQASVKIRQAQIIKRHGIFPPANRHTPNLPWTRRPHHKRPPHPVIWPCKSYINYVGH